MSERSAYGGLIRSALNFNTRGAHAIGNGFDWLFRRDAMIKSGKTWFELVYDGDPMSLRYYELPDERDIELADGSRIPIKRERYDVPLVLVPPLGVTTDTFDLLPDRSLVRYMAASGFKTYMIDWGKPTEAHSHLGLHDYSVRMFETALEQVREHSGQQQVSLMGWCMGGLFCLLYQGTHRDPNVRNMITVASPIDLRGGGLSAQLLPVLDGPAKLISRYSDLRLDMLDPAKVSAPPWLTTLAFKLTDPLSSVTTYWDLITGLSDRDFVENYSTTSDYLDNMLRYPGGVIRDLAPQAYDQSLAAGKVRVGDAMADLTKIDCNMLIFAGETDKLVAPPVAEKLVDLVSASDKEYRVAPGGHMGVILGSKAQTHVWPQSAQWLAQRSMLN